MTGIVSGQQWIALSKALSTERLSSFRMPEDPDYDRAIARYLWNAALCEAQYPMLHGVEVAVRNRLDSAVMKRFGGKWLENASLLSSVELRRVSEATAKLAYRGKGSPSHSEVVAELSLGFWVALFQRTYERSDKLWPLLCGDVMSGAPKSERLRTVFYARLDEIRDLRNRAFHYEPLWYWQDLVERHSRGCDFLRWLSPEVAALVSKMDRFDEVFERGVESYECLVEGGVLCPVHNIGCRHMRDAGCPSAPGGAATGRRS
jgi:hypothetical protein